MSREEQGTIPPESIRELFTKDELKRLGELAHCDKSPTGAHHFMLNTTHEDEDGDGPCKYCEVLFSTTRGLARKSKIGQNKKGGTRKMADNMIGVKEIAELAGVEGKIVRRVLRKQFGGGEGKLYTWAKEDPQIAKVVEAVKSRGKKVTKAVEPTGPLMPAGPVDMTPPEFEVTEDPVAKKKAAKAAADKKYQLKKAAGKAANVQS